MRLRSDGLRYVSAGSLKNGDTAFIEHKGATLLCIKGSSDRIAILLVLAAMHGDAPAETPMVLEWSAINPLDAWLVEDARIGAVSYSGLAPSPTFEPQLGSLVFGPHGGAGICVAHPSGPEKFEVFNVETGVGGLIEPDVRCYASWAVTVPWGDARRVLYERLVK